MSKFKIGIFGSAEGDFEKILEKLEELGKELAKHDLVLITGASTGLPYKIIKIAKENGTKEIWGFSQAVDLDSQNLANPDTDSRIYSKIIYIPKEYEFASDPQVCRKYRNVISTANCDAGIIISGRWGSLNEFTNLFDMGKVIGVLTGTGGIADELEDLSKKISKPSKVKVIFNSDPKDLVNLIIKELKNKNEL